MDKESSKMEPRPERREDETNDFLKPEESEGTKGNEIKNNDTWIKVAKIGKATESEHATTAAAVSFDSVQSRRNNPPQDPARPVRYLNVCEVG